MRYGYELAITIMLSTGLPGGGSSARNGFRNRAFIVDLHASPNPAFRQGAWPHRTAGPGGTPNRRPAPGARAARFLETLFNTIEDGVLVVDETAQDSYTSTRRSSASSDCT